MLSNQHCTVQYNIGHNTGRNVGRCLAGCIVARCASNRDQSVSKLMDGLERSRRRLQIVKLDGFNLTKFNPMKDESRHETKIKITIKKSGSVNDSLF